MTKRICITVAAIFFAGMAIADESNDDDSAQCHCLGKDGEKHPPFTIAESPNGESSVCQVIRRLHNTLSDPGWSCHWFPIDENPIVPPVNVIVPGQGDSVPYEQAIEACGDLGLELSQNDYRQLGRDYAFTCH